MTTDNSKAKSAKRQDMTLSIVFQGPFLFDFKDSPENDQTVDIYAPYCAYHEAGIFFGDNAYSETDLGTTLAYPKRRYFIAGPGITACPDAPEQIYPARPPHRADMAASNDPILKPLASETPELDTQKVMFGITVPRPSAIYPVNCDVVEIVRSFDQPAGPVAVMQIHATGLRFLYEWDSTTSISLYGPGCDPTDNTPADKGVYNITPAAAGNCPGMPEHGTIDIRYQGLELLDRNDPHSDARSCFASVATMAGATQWWLNYGDGMTTPADAISPVRIREIDDSYTGGDCGSPIIAHGLPKNTG